MLATWYGGEEAGTALAEVLFGDESPAGRLPVTFHKSLDQLPDFNNYHMAGRTYRFFEGDPLYPFGHGLSYTEFAYSDLTLPAAVDAGNPVEVSVTLTNRGDRAGDEVVQVYLTDTVASVPVPIRQLTAFRRVHLGAGASDRLTFTIEPEQMACYTDAGEPMIEPGEFLISVGGGQPLPQFTAAFVTGSFIAG
jgi:beta-glucosidase